MAAPNAGAGADGKADPLAKLCQNNREWSAKMREQDPQFFESLCKVQAPEFLWIGCSDSRVPANQILGLMPGEVFVQRNVGNQAYHTDLNLMSCLEYAVTELKVSTIIVCGHYNCGAVKAALTLPTRHAGMVNCWISGIRECRNEHHAELKGLAADAQVARLCELNVLRSAYNVVTSNVVQAAWAKGQPLNVYGCIYALKDGLVRRLIGPINSSDDFPHHKLEFTAVARAPEVSASLRATLDGAGRAESCEDEETTKQAAFTAHVAQKLALHRSWTAKDDLPPLPAAVAGAPAGAAAAVGSDSA